MPAAPSSTSPSSSDEEDKRGAFRAGLQRAFAAGIGLSAMSDQNSESGTSTQSDWSDEDDGSRVALSGTGRARRVTTMASK